jgi:peptidoglycan-associated lipoprotein
MKMLLVPALCAGLILAACADRGSLGRRALISPPPASSGTVTPGSLEDEPCGFANVGNTLYFETDSAVLTAEAQKYAQMQACWIKAYPQHTITIEGHADERGTREYNLALGERRADALMRYYIALGVDPRRLKTISYGKERPICTEADEACWSRNRRTVSTLDN